MLSLKNRQLALGGLTLVLCITTFFLPTIPQDLNYHLFADKRTFFHIPNFFDVLSNIPISLVGLYGLYQLYFKKTHFSEAELRLWTWLFASFFLVGLGSGYYHWAPSNESLVWDRIPLAMTVVNLIALLVFERVSQRFGRIFLMLINLFAIFSVFYWIYMEKYDVGDLRFYILVQFGGAIIIAAILILFPTKHSSKPLGYAFISYVLAKLFEHFDATVFSALSSMLSGHTIKHLFTAICLYYIYRYFQSRTHIRS